MDSEGSYNWSALAVTFLMFAGDVVSPTQKNMDTAFGTKIRPFPSMEMVNCTTELFTIVAPNCLTKCVRFLLFFHPEEKGQV